jgi:endonuclease YncB( thermonuclease family)
MIFCIFFGDSSGLMSIRRTFSSFRGVFVALALSLGLVAIPASALPILKGVVVAVADGDTLTIVDASNRKLTVRLFGIDAPDRLQAFGEKSRSNLAAIALNRHVEIVRGKTGSDGGPRNAVMATVLVADPNCHAVECPKIHDAGLLQLMSGMAWREPQHATEQTARERADYEVGEFNAKSRRIGLWSDPNPTPPWAWRK